MTDPQTPTAWPADTIAAVFHRGGPDDPWRLHGLYTGDARHNDLHDAGWNSAAEANLYALSGSGPGVPVLHALTAPDPTTSAVWSSVGWMTTVGTVAEGFRYVAADPVALGWGVLDALPDIPLQKVERLLCCETCKEEQDADDLCGHIWWCEADEGWRGALNDSPSGPCEKGCRGCVHHD